jgi:hypothetical protein
MATVKTELPSFQTYGNYSSDNYGAHALQFFMPRITLWFSYKTVVAFRTIGGGLRVSENCWGPTTGKHLNAIDGGNKKSRLPRDKFEEELASALDENE